MCTPCNKKQKSENSGGGDANGLRKVREERRRRGGDLSLVAGVHHEEERRGEGRNHDALRLSVDADLLLREGRRSVWKQRGEGGRGGAGEGGRGGAGGSSMSLTSSVLASMSTRSPTRSPVRGSRFAYSLGSSRGRLTVVAGEAPARVCLIGRCARKNVVRTPAHAELDVTVGSTWRTMRWERRERGDEEWRKEERSGEGEDNSLSCVLNDKLNVMSSLARNGRKQDGAVLTVPVLS
eukprot:757279-Hanusia_phi.AAC.2